MPAVRNQRYEQKLLKGYKKAVGRLEPWLHDRYGRQAAEQILLDSTIVYEALIPEIPDLGRQLHVSLFFLPTTRYLAVYRAMKRLGYPDEEIGSVILKMGSAAIRAIPPIVRRLIGQLWFSAYFRKRLRKRAVESQKSSHPGGFVFQFVEGHGEAFDYGIDYLECASLKYLTQEHALPLAPYVCATDIAASQLLHWGLTREHTLVAGCPRCDFRFSKNGPTRVPLPAEMTP